MKPKTCRQSVAADCGRAERSFSQGNPRSTGLPASDAARRMRWHTSRTTGLVAVLRSLRCASSSMRRGWRNVRQCRKVGDGRILCVLTGIHLPVIQERSSRTHTGVNALLLSVTPTNPPLCAHKSPTLCAQIPHFVAATSRVQACGSYGCWLFTLTGDQYATPDSRPLLLGEVSIHNFETLPRFELRK